MAIIVDKDKILEQIFDHQEDDSLVIDNSQLGTGVNSISDGIVYSLLKNRGKVNINKQESALGSEEDSGIIIEGGEADSDEINEPELGSDARDFWSGESGVDDVAVAKSVPEQIDAEEDGTGTIAKTKPARAEEAPYLDEQKPEKNLVSSVQAQIISVERSAGKNGEDIYDVLTNGDIKKVIFDNAIALPNVEEPINCEIELTGDKEVEAKGIGKTNVETASFVRVKDSEGETNSNGNGDKKIEEKEQAKKIDLSPYFQDRAKWAVVSPREVSVITGVYNENNPGDIKKLPWQGHKIGSELQLVSAGDPEHLSNTDLKFIELNGENGNGIQSKRVFEVPFKEVWKILLPTDDGVSQEDIKSALKELISRTVKEKEGDSSQDNHHGLNFWHRRGPVNSRYLYNLNHQTSSTPSESTPTDEKSADTESALATASKSVSEASADKQKLDATVVLPKEIPSGQNGVYESSNGANAEKNEPINKVVDGSNQNDKSEPISEEERPQRQEQTEYKPVEWRVYNYNGEQVASGPDASKKSKTGFFSALTHGFSPKKHEEEKHDYGPASDDLSDQKQAQLTNQEQEQADNDIETMHLAPENANNTPTEIVTYDLSPDSVGETNNSSNKITIDHVDKGSGSQPQGSYNVVMKNENADANPLEEEDAAFKRLQDARKKAASKNMLSESMQPITSEVSGGASDNYQMQNDIPSSQQKNDNGSPESSSSLDQRITIDTIEPAANQPPNLENIPAPAEVVDGNTTASEINARQTATIETPPNYQIFQPAGEGGEGESVYGEETSESQVDAETASGGTETNRALDEKSGDVNAEMSQMARQEAELLRSDEGQQSSATMENQVQEAGEEEAAKAPQEANGQNPPTTGSSTNNGNWFSRLIGRGEGGSSRESQHRVLGKTRGEPSADKFSGL